MIAQIMLPESEGYLNEQIERAEEEREPST